MAKDGILREGDYIFDGFAHRQFHEEYDGWMNTQNAERKYFDIIQMASGILEMAAEINDLRYKNWQLEKEKDMWKSTYFPDQKVG